MNGHTTRDLFDGAIKTCIPSTYLDARYPSLLLSACWCSNFREVPDNQEIFVSAEDDSSIMVDVLEFVPVPGEEAAEFHFEALKADNEVEDEEEDSRVFKSTEVPAAEHPLLAYGVPQRGWCSDFPCFNLLGYQRIVKGHYRSSVAAGGSTSVQQSDHVLLFLVVFRLQEKNTDVVVSINYPLHMREDLEVIHTQDNEAVVRWTASAERVGRVEQLFRDIIASFEIVKWDLFDETE
jgi:Ran-interacting Mog1 protein